MKPGKTISQFEDKFGKGRIAQLEGILATMQGSHIALPIDVPDENNTISFAVMGDTQEGNICCATEEKLAFYEILKSEGITTLFHTGDVLDGHRVYKGQEFDLFALGFAAQRNSWLKTTPEISGLTTYFITGNHDASFKNLAGVSVGRELSDLRPDWKFLGEDQGEVTLRTSNEREYRVRLVHPAGGTAYAISYKAQKQAESITGGNKPNMICIGHYHKADHLPNYRNIDVIQSGCLEWQTGFMARIPTPAHVGAWIVRVTVGDQKSMSNRVQAEFISYYSKDNS